MSLIGHYVYYGGHHCMVMVEGMGYRPISEDEIEMMPILTISRTEGAFVGGQISIGNVAVSDEKLFIPPSAVDYQQSEWYSAITGIPIE